MAILTFQYLRELQKKERDSPMLQQIDARFYKTLSECIKSSGDENFASTARSIFDMRERKIVSSAVKSARADTKPKNILPEEEPLFLEVCNAVKSYRQSLDKLLAGDAASMQNEGAVEKIAGESIQSLDGKPVPALIKLRALIDMPAFICEDLKTYGPFKTGDVAEVPGKAAEILLKSKSAELLSTLEGSAPKRVDEELEMA